MHVLLLDEENARNKKRSSGKKEGLFLLILTFVMRRFTQADNYDAFALTKHSEIYRLAVISVRNIPPLIFKNVDFYYL